MEVNPYEAPQTAAPAAIPEISESAEAIRHAHLTHEASVKSIGFLYYLGGIISLVAGVGAGLSSSASGVAKLGEQVGELLVISIIVAAQMFIGYGFRRLKTYSRVLGGIISAIGVIKFPIGTLISAYILYLLFSKKGNMVFSPAYKEVIAATPHIRYKSSLLVRICLWILLGIVVLVGVSMVWTMFSKR